MAQKMQSAREMFSRAGAFLFLKGIQGFLISNLLLGAVLWRTLGAAALGVQAFLLVSCSLLGGAGWQLHWPGRKILFAGAWTLHLAAGLRELLKLGGWLYLTRVSLLGLIVFFAMPLLAKGGGRSLIIGAYDLRTGPSALLVSGLMVLTAWCLYASASLALAYGALRSRLPLGEPPPWKWPTC